MYLHTPYIAVRWFQYFARHMLRSAWFSRVSRLSSVMASVYALSLPPPPAAAPHCRARSVSPRAVPACPQELFPQFADMVTDEAYERLALQEVSRLPAFSYTGPVLHLGESAVLLGELGSSGCLECGLRLRTYFVFSNRSFSASHK